MIMHILSSFQLEVGFTVKFLCLTYRAEHTYPALERYVDENGVIEQINSYPNFDYTRKNLT